MRSITRDRRRSRSSRCRITCAGCTRSRTRSSRCSAQQADAAGRGRDDLREHGRGCPRRSRSTPRGCRGRRGCRRCRSWRERDGEGVPRLARRGDQRAERARLAARPRDRPTGQPDRCRPVAAGRDPRRARAPAGRARRRPRSAARRRARSSSRSRPMPRRATPATASSTRCTRRPKRWSPNSSRRSRRMRDELHALERERDALAARTSALSMAVDQKDGSAVDRRHARHPRPGRRARSRHARLRGRDRRGARNARRCRARRRPRRRAVGPGARARLRRRPRRDRRRGCRGRRIRSARFRRGVAAASEFVTAPAGILGILSHVVIVDDLDVARAAWPALREIGGLTAITRAGDVLTEYVLRGGTGAQALAARTRRRARRRSRAAQRRQHLDRARAVRARREARRSSRPRRRMRRPRWPTFASSTPRSPRTPSDSAGSASSSRRRRPSGSGSPLR